jgi:hypothetical protein
MDQAARFQETLRRLAMIDEGFAEIGARVGLDQAMTSAPDPKTTALLQLAEDREARWTGACEVICCDCGDHPYLGYSGISPRLQRIRGPYTLAAGVAAYAGHLGLAAARRRS